MLKAVATRIFAPLSPNYSHYSDEQLAQLAADSAKARDVLVLRLSDDVLYFLQAQLVSLSEDSHTRRQLALDLLHEVWLRWLAQPQRFSPQQQGSFKAWLFSLARNQVIDYARRKKRHLPVEECLQEPNLHLDAQHIEGLIMAATEQQLTAAIADLPHLQREALTLQLEGFSLQEIAQITASAQESVKTRLRYARAKIAATMVKGAQ
ncbi:RNA polymerase sigma factor [Pseudoalteromonas sp. T1lg10]|uniref:RNA polymerase sigma factor n=1 Tax=Pseudoalteromonas sp. T1lg10 TaxID=2077093 RepID=UPI000CF6B3E0|nr:RNA polymerase sigma factor [Pseudoalteromonas sp. T1lg10]